MSRPRHQNGDIEAAIRYAESHGWSVRKSGPRAKPWGRIWCPFQEHSQHQMSVWSTPKNPQNHAKQIVRFVDRCRRETEEQFEELQPLSI